jgi:hypothetical protein
VQPELLWQGGVIEPARLAAVVTAARRIQAHRLAVVIALDPATWHLEASAADRLRLIETWRMLARALSGLDPDLLMPELLNEPVFANDAEGWQRLQSATLATVRAVLPEVTVILTGANWGGVDGLLALAPINDPDVVYSLHFYEPTELTALAAWKPGLDRAALARLPFPADDAAACADALRGTDAGTADIGRYYCATHWDDSRIAARLDAVAAWSRAHAASVMIGEFGATRDLPPATRLAWLRAVRTEAETRHIGWTLWGYDDVMGLGIARPVAMRPALDAATLAALGLGR